MKAASGRPAEVLLVFFDKERLSDYLHLAARLRAAGVAVELFPEAKKVGQQLKYADRRGFRAAIIAGSRDYDQGIVQVKDLESGQQQEVAIDESASQIVAAVKAITHSTR